MGAQAPPLPYPILGAHFHLLGHFLLVCRFFFLLILILLVGKILIFYPELLCVKWSNNKILYSF